MSHAWGSPPHTRGKESARCSGRGEDGITPAYAGKSNHWGFLIPRLEDHPRIRGEKPASQQKRPGRWGSPPHTRGKGYGKPRRCSEMGITPAYAGKSFLLSDSFTQYKDHPRIRGEKTKKIPFTCHSLHPHHSFSFSF